ncbi:glycosyltransferase family 25 protein [Stenotrophomonas sp.]|uniref:glycosyltransferase family 25 protein n=1 Tax=Stenotrophomonas sp. TaxID=69392 RepID=UPI0028A99EAC|nr:glycosyltransferase family 25 protein [Stenotrophomonas sp.]
MSLPLSPPPLYVVNLPASVDRRESMQRQAVSLGLTLEFFEAVNGRQPHPLFAHVDEGRRVANKGRPFKPGELGCWASHYLLWQRCVQRGEPIIVLEDDIQLSPRFVDLLQALPQLPAQVGYFRLHAGDRPSTPWLQFGDFVLHRYWRSPLCTLGYYLTPDAAEKLLRHARRWVLPVDDYMDLAWLHGVECLGLKPGVVRSDEDFESTIQVGRGPKPAVGPWGWVTREGYRAGLNLRWFLHNLPHRLRRHRI